MSKPIGAREQALRQAREAEAKSAGKPPRTKVMRDPAWESALVGSGLIPAPATIAVSPEKMAVLHDRKAAKKKTRPKSGSALASVVARTKPAKKIDRSPLAVGTFVCRDGGCTMEQLVKRFGIEAHPMRTKIHAAKHELGFKIEYDRETKRYTGTAPKEKQ